jgi:hypothetical protein
MSIRSGSAAILACLAGTVIAADIPWRNADRVAAFESARAQEAPADALQRLSGRESRVVVTFASIPTPAERQALAESGVTLLAPLGGPAFFARIDPTVQPSRAARSAPFEFVGEIAPAHRLDEKLTGIEAPSWALAEAGADPAANPVVGVYVQLHADVSPMDAGVRNMIALAGGVVRDTVQSVNMLVVELPFRNIADLAEDGRVQWIEPPLPRMGMFNADNRIRVQANEAQAAPYNLDGSGVTVFVYDGGAVRTTHNDFQGRATVIDGDATNYHSTHVAGTIGGAGIANATHKGMAPGVGILSAGFEYDGSGTFLYTNPGDLEFDYTNAINQGADMSNNSIGSNVAPNGFPCSYEGDYGLTAATIDAVVRGSLGEPIVIFWAAGNERGSGSCGTTYNTTPPPSNNKNSITVGALNSNNDTVTSFTSWGPSDDGRIRPVISAPGCQSNADGGVTSTDSASNTAYTTLCGTSMASPTACGVGALIYDDFRATFPGQPDPSNQLMKVWLAHNAVDLGNPGPDNQTGYGSIRAIPTIDFVRTGQWDEGSVDNGGIQTFTVDVAPGTPELKLTMAWDDVPGTPNVSPALVNDLDLVVVDPNGARHYPWTINPASPGSPAVKTQEDHLNNIEQVQVSNPASGRWMIQVVGHSVPQGPQGFAIAGTPALGPGLLAASLESGVPDLLAPATPLEVRVGVEPGVDALVPGSVALHYRLNGGAYTVVPMGDAGGGDFLSTIPGANCDQTMEFFVTAEGVEAGVVTVPPGGTPFAVEIGEIETILVDNFETDLGWTVSGDATDGQWTRGIPVDCSSRGAPGADADGSGQCWVTDNSAASSCNSDVDNGTTILTSPVFDLPDGAQVSYRYWFSDIASGGINGDEWGVDYSTNGGSNWTRLRTVTSVAATWRSDTIFIGDDVPAGANLRFRFTANDVGTQNVIEAGLDDFRISRQFCEDVNLGCNPADIAEPFDVLDLADVQAFIAGFTGQDPVADIAAPFGVWDLADVQSFIASFNAGCP